MQNADLEVVHGRTFATITPLTLRDWCRNLVEHWDSAVAEVGLPTAKVWGLYMAGSRLGFLRPMSFNCTRCWRSNRTAGAGWRPAVAPVVDAPSGLTVDPAGSEFVLQ